MRTGTETVGQRLRYMRRAMGLSQAALAQQVGISTRRLREYEHDRRIPDEQTLHAFADALNIAPDYLLRPSMVGEIWLLYCCRMPDGC